jgi:hypothetical protein
VEGGRRLLYFPELAVRGDVAEVALSFAAAVALVGVAASTERRRRGWSHRPQRTTSRRP